MVRSSAIISEHDVDNGVAYVSQKYFIPSAPHSVSGGRRISPILKKTLEA